MRVFIAFLVLFYAAQVEGGGDTIRVPSSSWIYRGAEGAHNWLSFCRNPRYTFYHDSVKRIESSGGDIIGKHISTRFKKERFPGLTFVSLGPGDGVKDYFLMRAMVKSAEKKTSMPEVNYVPIDVNETFIFHSMIKVIEGAGFERPVRFFPLLEDFSRIRSFRTFGNRNNLRVFSLLGNTLGNTAQESILLSRIYRGMNAQDLFLLELREYPGNWELLYQIQNLSSDLGSGRLSSFKRKHRSIIWETLSDIKGTASLARGHVASENNRDVFVVDKLSNSYQAPYVQQFLEELGFHVVNLDRSFYGMIFTLRKK